MPIIERKRKRECTDFARFDTVITGADVGNTILFAGILPGHTVIDANVTVVEAFENADNNISVGVEGDLVKFIPATTVNAIKGVGFSNKQYTAEKETSLFVNVTGTVSTTGKAIVSIMYAKNATSRVDY
ncbi:MAG: hypothetical protein RBT59_10515 [Arcobacteraceae bacterium]|jgi:hypothetical protein|nr:hypothetical protein [Arcobacteraceae bacterium]